MAKRKKNDTGSKLIKITRGSASINKKMYKAGDGHGYISVDSSILKTLDGSKLVSYEVKESSSSDISNSDSETDVTDDDEIPGSITDAI